MIRMEAQVRSSRSDFVVGAAEGTAEDETVGRAVGAEDAEVDVEVVDEVVLVTSLLGS